MALLLAEIRHNPLLWLLVFVPAVLAAELLRPEAHTLLFVLSVLAIVPLSSLLSHATLSVAARTRDTVRVLLYATLRNLTVLVIAITALRAFDHLAVVGVHRRRYRHLHVVHASRFVPSPLAHVPHAVVSIASAPAFMPACSSWPPLPCSFPRLSPYPTPHPSPHSFRI